MCVVRVGGEGVRPGERTLIARAVRFVCGAAGARKVSVEIYLCPDAEMQRIKRHFFPGKRGPADVYSFPENTPFPGPARKARPLGEIYVNRDLGSRDEKRRVFLSVHGVLHLLGYDHLKKRDMLTMKRLEDETMKSIF